MKMVKNPALKVQKFKRRLGHLIFIAQVTMLEVTLAEKRDIVWKSCCTSKLSMDQIKFCKNKIIDFREGELLYILFIDIYLTNKK